MKKTLCRRLAAVLTVLLAVALPQGLAFADTPGRTPDTSPPVTVSADEYEYEYEYDPDAPWLYYDMTEEEYYEEFEPWRAEGQTEEEYWDEYYKKFEEETRTDILRELGFTDMDIPNLIVNGQALNFTGAKPFIQRGVTMIPARAVLEALGAELLYDGKAKRLTAVLGDTTAAFTVGSRTVLITRDGLTTELEAAAAPFIDGASAAAYVPLRASAEGLGLALYWDNFYKVAEIVDKEALIAEIDADFTVFNALLGSAYRAAAESFASGKAEQTDVNFTAELDMRYRPSSSYADEIGETKENSVKLAGAYTVLAGPDGLDLAGEATVTGVETFLTEPEQDPEMTDMLRDLKNGVPFTFLFDYTTLDFYMQMPLFAYIHPLLQKDTWVAFLASDYGAAADAKAATAALEELFTSGEDITIGRLLYVSADGLFHSYPRAYDFYNVNFSRSDDLLRAARALAPFLGDVYMERDGDTHTISLNRLELFSIFRKLADEGTMYIGVFDDYAGFLEAVPAADYTLRIREKGGAPASVELAVNVKTLEETYDGETRTVEFHCDAGAEAQKASVDCSASFDLPSETANFVFHADAVSAPADKAPRTAPPDGAKVILADEL
ncbi:MAG: copper amine oxidase N-terminal domain-containing protein [Synergistaceae bacterium]|nr:copper amine oxidase N-terminal domain-containing protein [Synergistaceae bacterium]